MRRQLVSFGVLVVLIGATSWPARGAEPAAPTGFRAEFVAEVDNLGKKLTGLANATPQEKFGWRPAPGIRSISEVYVHIAGANYLLPSFMGVEVPEGVSRDMEKTITEKAKVIETLKNSLEHLRSVASNVSDADLEKKVKFFSREMTERALMIVMLNHMHEHLGQSIAYARINGVAPPWSEGAPPPPAKKS